MPHWTLLHGICNYMPFAHLLWQECASHSQGPATSFAFRCPLVWPRRRCLTRDHVTRIVRYATYFVKHKTLVPGIGVVAAVQASAQLCSSTLVTSNCSYACTISHPYYHQPNKSQELRVSASSCSGSGWICRNALSRICCSIEILVQSRPAACHNSSVVPTTATPNHHVPQHLSAICQRHMSSGPSVTYCRHVLTTVAYACRVAPIGSGQAPLPNRLLVASLRAVT